MANLLSRKLASPPFPRFDPEQCARLETRFATLTEVVARPSCSRELDRLIASLETEQEEFESIPSLVTALDLLDGIARARRAALDCPPDGPDHDRSESTVRSGEFVCYWPGRSLATGEAEIASRGFFDGFDRPPIRYWLEAICRRTASREPDFEIAMVAWVPAEDLARARAGCESCPSRSLAFLDDLSPELARQLTTILRVGATR